MSDNAPFAGDPSEGAEACAFCEIIQGRRPATIVAQNDLVIALMDLRQFHLGHVLVISRRHLQDIRDADDAIAAAVMQMVAHVSRAVAALFPSDGLSIWHSAGAGANQEVPHLHVHIHPRTIGDDLLRIYPHSPPTPPRDALESCGAKLSQLLEASPQAALGNAPMHEHSE